MNNHRKWWIGGGDDVFIAREEKGCTQRNGFRNEVMEMSKYLLHLVQKCMSTRATGENIYIEQPAIELQITYEYFLCGKMNLNDEEWGPTISLCDQYAFSLVLKGRRFNLIMYSLYIDSVTTLCKLFKLDAH